MRRHRRAVGGAGAAGTGSTAAPIQAANHGAATARLAALEHAGGARTLAEQTAEPSSSTLEATCRCIVDAPGRRRRCSPLDPVLALEPLDEPTVPRCADLARPGSTRSRSASRIGADRDAHGQARAAPPTPRLDGSGSSRRLPRARGPRPGFDLARDRACITRGMSPRARGGEPHARRRPRISPRAGLPAISRDARDGPARGLAQPAARCQIAGALRHASAAGAAAAAREPRRPRRERAPASADGIVSLGHTASSRRRAGDTRAASQTLHHHVGSPVDRVAPAWQQRAPAEPRRSRRPPGGLDAGVALAAGAPERQRARHGRADLGWPLVLIAAAAIEAAGQFCDAVGARRRCAGRRRSSSSREYSCGDSRQVSCGRTRRRRRSPSCAGSSVSAEPLAAFAYARRRR